MSTPAIAFSIYIFIGLFLMIVVVASPKKEKRTKGFESLGAGTGLDAGLLIFIAILWPVWPLATLARKKPKE